MQLETQGMELNWFFGSKMILTGWFCKFYINANFNG